jgi:acetate kinase
MNVLTINCGSSSLKYELCTAGPGSSVARLTKGTVDRIGEIAAMPDHTEACRLVLKSVTAAGLPKPDAVVHRVVHGGDRFVAPARIDDTVLADIEALAELAPLHNGPAVAAIRATRMLLGPAVPMVAVFDTAFHRTLPPVAASYALPLELAAAHKIRRYGFHGIAHRSMAERYVALTRAPTERTKLITLQLGNGCSAAAVAGGRSVDTSMGFTPLEGLMMGTRSGDADPSLAAYLAQHAGMAPAEVEDLLNRRSGLLGVSGTSRDMRDLLERERQGDDRAALAVEMFCYRVRKYIGAYLAVLGGADAVIFGGGIGEHAPAVRARICAGMEWCGLRLDGSRNEATVGTEGQISTGDATLHAYVIPVDEAIILVNDTVQCLTGRKDEG